MSNYFTKRNMTNWKWWIAISIALITIVTISPLIILGVLIDFLSVIFDLIHRKMDKFMSGKWRKIGEWVKS